MIHSIIGGINSTFLTKLDTSTGILSVVEANMFKQLTHIYLQMRPGNDSSVKNYLASRLSLSLSVSQRQSVEIEALHNFLSSEREMNAKLSKELTELKNYRESDVQTLTSHHTQEVSQLQMQNIELMEQARVRYENQIESLRNTLDVIQKEIQTKAATFEQTTSDLNFEKSQLEFKVRDLTRQLAGAEEDRDRMNNEYQKMYSSRHVVEEARLNLERDLAKNVTKVESLLQQLRDKDEMIQTSTALHKASEESRLSTEQRLEMYVSNSEVMQEKLKQTAVEIDKGNNVISLLQNEIKQLRDKVKMKSDVIRRQEVLVTELRSKISDNEKAIQSLNEQYNLSKSNNASLQRSLDDANEKLNESMKLIASNQEVITYLNEEINKWQLGLRSHTAMNASSVITPTRYFHGNSLNQSPDSVILQGRTPLITSNQTSKLYSSTSNEMADLNLSDAGVDKDTLLKGLSNLGLSEASFGYDAGIESLDYYATGMSTNKSLLSAQSGGSKKKTYDWQRESFQ